MSYSSIVSITIYFILNLLVTISSKQLVTSTSSPYLLTASHAFATFVATIGFSSLRLLVSSTANPVNSPPSHDESRLPIRTHAILLAFSLLYTVNIGVSNLTLGLVSLAMHQTIRASAPAITVFLTITVLKRPPSFYPVAIYFSLIPTILGVALATIPSASASTNPGGKMRNGTENTRFGIALTFVSALLAVAKTMITHQLQQPPSSSHARMNIGLGLPAIQLVKYLSPYAVAQALCFAYWNGELQQVPLTTRIKGEAGGGQWMGTWAILSMLSASALNIASFEANRRCGALSMGVAGNLKQVFILMLASLSRGGAGHHAVPEWRVALGILMTTIGGMWYAWVTSRMKNRPVR